MTKSELVALLFLSFFNVMWLLLFCVLPRGDMGWSVVCDSGFPGYTRLLFIAYSSFRTTTELSILSTSFLAEVITHIVIL